MPSIFDPLVEIIHSGTLDSWKERNEKALAGLFGSRYAKRAEKAVTLRAPDMRGSDSECPLRGVHPSFQRGRRCLWWHELRDFSGRGRAVPRCNGDRDTGTCAGRGHSRAAWSFERKMQAISTWLNHQFGGGDQVAWAKQDPTRVDIDVPESIQRAWSAYERVFKRYGTGPLCSV